MGKRRLSAKEALTKVQAIIIIVVIVVAAVGIAFYYFTLPPPGPSGTLIITDSNEPRTLHPALATTRDVESSLFQCVVYETLVVLDETGNIVPRLAESYEQKDSLTYIFHLRSGVKFHDGTPFNASAVKYNFDWFMGQEAVLNQEAIRSGIIDEVSVIDEDTIEIVLKHPHREFLVFLSTWQTIISPTAIEKLGDDGLATRCVGTGPFKFVEYVAGDHITIEAFEDYWDESPNIEKVIYYFNAEESTRVLQLETGETDMIDVLLPENVKRLKDAGFKEHTTSAPYPYLLWIGGLGTNASFQPTPALRDKRVRQALNYAVDRRELVDKLLEGYGTPAFMPLPPGAEPFYDSFMTSLNVYPETADLDKAKQLLAEAGYPDGFETTVIVAAAATDRVQACEVIAEQLAKVGITMNIEPLSFPVLVERAFAGDWPMILEYHTGPSVFAPYSYLFTQFDSSQIGPGLWNLQHIENSTIDQLLEEYLGATTVEQATQIMDDINNIIVNEEAYCVYLYYPEITFMASPKVEGVFLHPDISFWSGFAICVPVLDINYRLKEEA